MKIISGGQTGVDRAALDVALELGLPCGGWCPKGRKAEDGPIDSKYPLKETESDDYAVRTEWNVRDSDGTLIITRGKPTGGTAYTVACCKMQNKPHLVIDLYNFPSPRPSPTRGEGENDGLPSPLMHQIHSWLTRHNIRTLNIAGPRENNVPGIYQKARKIISSLNEELT
ncbi:MAG: hypothetical protein A3I09_02565 [Deltaproteobacteria bacterium RIFCSPLOWO2_02_FULL_47_10]|nr:MAG: hypothetical protein A3I09_02565 [Deltaproteobacteria bacterium RIFCSPLOWO2_02_FULL_47_10]